MQMRRSKRKKKPGVEIIERGFVGNLFYRLGVAWARLITDISVEGIENLPEPPYILCPNHETYVDGLLVFSCLPEKHFELASALAAADLGTQHGTFGKIILRVGNSIPLDRKGSSSSSLMTAVDALEDGRIVLIHPEGTRSRNGKLGKIKSGVSLIARKAGVPIVPIFIDGAYEVFNRHMKFPKGRDKNGKKRKIVMHFGEQINPDSYDKTRDITAAIEKWMHKMFDNKVVPRTFNDKGFAIY